MELNIACDVAQKSFLKMLVKVGTNINSDLTV